MPELYQDVNTRGAQTVAVWDEFNPTLKIGKLTLSDHTTDVDSLLTLAALRNTAKEAWDLAAALRMQALGELDNWNTRVPHVIENSLEEESPLFSQFAEIYAIQGNGPADVQKRAGKVIPLWKLANTERAAQVPPLAPLDLDGELVTDMETLLTNLPILAKTANDKKAEWSKTKSELRMAVEKVDRNNKRWFETWANNYPVGTPEHDALDTIDTETGGAAPVAQAVIVMAMALGGLVIDLHFQADHATTFTVLYRVLGTTAFSTLAADLDTDTFHGPMPMAGQFELQVVGNNSEGPGPASAIYTLTVT